jgi:uncharacterized protein
MTNIIIQGPAGALEMALDLPPAGTPIRALALVTHPHPLHGGTMDNKVTTTLSRACAALGCAALRFNYRGVGRSAGVFDNTVGETDDALAALNWLRSQLSAAAGLPLVLCGFSFGTAVAARLAQRLAQHSAPVLPVAMVLAGAAVQRFADVGVNPDVTLCVHGELDDTVPLAETLLWARAYAQPITVIPNADHFFNKQLIALKSVTLRHLSACLAKI